MYLMNQLLCKIHNLSLKYVVKAGPIHFWIIKVRVSMNFSVTLASFVSEG